MEGFARLSTGKGAAPESSQHENRKSKGPNKWHGQELVAY